MTQLIKRLLVSLAILVTLAVALVSCSGKSEVLNPGGGSGGNGGGGITPLSISITSVSPDSIFNGQRSYVKAEANQICTVNGVTGTKFEFWTDPAVAYQTKDTTRKITVSGVTPSGSSFTVSRDQLVPSKDKGTLCWNDLTSDYNKWKNTISKVSHDGGLTWSDGPKDLMLWVKYYGDNTRKNPSVLDSNIMLKSGYQLRYEGTTMFINLAETFQPKNEFKVLSLEQNKYIIEQEKPGSIYRLTYEVQE